MGTIEGYKNNNMLLMASSDNFMAINSVIFLGNEDQQH
jgi:hypothetical protein